MITSILIAATTLSTLATPTSSHLKADNAACQAVYVKAFNSAVDTAQIAGHSLHDPRLPGLIQRTNKLKLEFDACDQIIGGELKLYYKLNGFDIDQQETPTENS